MKGVLAIDKVLLLVGVVPHLTSRKNSLPSNFGDFAVSKHQVHFIKWVLLVGINLVCQISKFFLVIPKSQQDPQKNVIFQSST